MDLLDKWVEIFRAGEHVSSDGRQRYWSEEDLDEIVRNYNPKEHEAPVVVGHPKTNDPAYGWVEALKRVGSILLAKFKQIDPEFAEKVKAGRYKKRSASIMPGNRLNHVGFLGAAVPAVSGLADLNLGGDGPIYEFAMGEGEDEGTEDFFGQDGCGISFSEMNELFKYV
jgi:hypothetical protein